MHWDRASVLEWRIPNRRKLNVQFCRLLMLRCDSNLQSGALILAEHSSIRVSVLDETALRFNDSIVPSHDVPVV